MSSSFTISNLTNTSARLNYTIDNSTRDFGIFVTIFLVQGIDSYQNIEANYPAGLSQTRGVSPFETLTSFQDRTGLSQNTTYTYFWSMTRDDPRIVGFNPADVIQRRPLSPPGTFTTFGPPIYTDSTLASPGTVGVFYSDGVTASSVVSYSISSGSLPPGLTLSSNTGSISGVPSFAGTYNFTISANNSYGSTLLPKTIVINPAAPVWIDQTISSPAFKDAPYSDGVSASNGATYSITSGSLPTGLSLNSSTGAITGTPTVVETKNFTIRAQNVTGAITVGLTLQVVDSLQPPSFTDSTLSTNLRDGIAYSDAVSATNTPTYTTTGTFVPGLTLNSSTGAVAGTPTAQGTYNFNIVASNAAGSATASFSLPVKPGGFRWDGSSWTRIQTFKRWNGSAWVDVTSTKRWNGSAWVDANL